MDSENSHEINASLGSEVLRRFNVVLNLPNNETYLSPNNCFGKPFNYNMSGIEVITPVPDARTYIVSRVRTNSAAEAAGIRTGDELLSINGVSISAFDLDGIYSSLLGREGKKIKLRFMRDTEIIEVTFRLEKII
jgi:C-terminal processing protease CtpA/Prc